MTAPQEMQGRTQEAEEVEVFTGDWTWPVRAAEPSLETVPLSEYEARYEIEPEAGS